MASIMAANNLHFSPVGKPQISAARLNRLILVVKRMAMCRDRDRESVRH